MCFIRMNVEIFLPVALEAVRQAAVLLRSEFVGRAGVLMAEGRDLKTEADRASESLILRHLASTGIPVLAEESGGDLATAGFCWVVDPLDGTVNFDRGFPMAGISLGLLHDGRPALGVIADLWHDAVYHGIPGHGAYKNGSPIQVSTRNNPAQSVLTTGFPTGTSFSTHAISDFIGRVQAFKKIRMIGSAALSLAFVAEGVFDAYYEENIFWWDIAAGAAIVEAAGGKAAPRPLPGSHKVHLFAGPEALDFTAAHRLD